MIEIKAATTLQGFKTIEALADAIWREHYIPIIGKAQVDYMLDKFQSAGAIEKQVSDGAEYYLIHFEDIPVGYISIKKETKALFLSKIYVSSAYRGRKIGKAALAFVEEKSQEYKLKKIRLTVNINNANSIKAYEKMGFKKEGPIVMDIGNGYVMDDYEMVKTI